eukprot:UN08359
MFITLVIQHWRIGGTYLNSSHPQRFDHTTNTVKSPPKKLRK